MSQPGEHRLLARAVPAWIAVVAAGGLAVPKPASAHDWYPRACCQDLDCAPLADGAVDFTPAGWLVLETGEIIPLDDSRVRSSRDRQFHRCRLEFWDSRSGTRCLFIPAPDG